MGTGYNNPSSTEINYDINMLTYLRTVNSIVYSVFCDLKTCRLGGTVSAWWDERSQRYEVRTEYRPSFSPLEVRSSFTYVANVLGKS